MNIIVIEDNLSAQRVLRDLLSDFCPDSQIVGMAENVANGLKQIATHKPDLVFLDVEMPDGTAFDLLKQLPEIDFKIVFTTAHEKYALQAIKFSALDYLLKPIDPDEFILAIDKVKSDNDSQLLKLKTQTLFNNLNVEGKTNQRIILKDKYGLQIVKIDEIIRIEAMSNYTQFFIVDQSPIVTSKVLKEYTNLLPQSQFFRCHQSHLINLDYLIRYDKREGDMLLLKGGGKVPLATRKREALLREIGKK